MNGSLERLRRIALLRLLPEEELATLPAEEVIRDAGEALFSQSAPGDAVYGLVTGRMKLTKASVRGRDLILDIASSGELMGVIAVLRGIPMPESAIALDPSACLRIPGPAFRQALERHPLVAVRMLETIAHRLLEADAARLSLVADPVDVRLARVLLGLGEKFGVRRGETLVFTQPLTRQNLADLAGTTVETTIRVLSRWGREEFISWQSGRLTIQSPGTLERLLESADQ